MGENINLLRALINCAEKAANIARTCRSNSELLALLVQEKTGAEANERFEHDFKTLADVLIQETIKHEIGELFPAMRDAIQGEESPNFTNHLGQKVTIAVGDNEAATAACLSAVLGDDHQTASNSLAAEVHRKVVYDNAKLADIPELPAKLDYSNLGIWIDPIDATAEYISGDTVFTNFPGITSTGLDCVTVLIGVYERDSGVPVIGIVAQPFANKLEEHVYSTSLYWGVCLANTKAHNCHNFPGHDDRGKIGIFSSSEDAQILQRFRDLKYELAFSAGAGHKALKVITNDADVYLLSKGSTFRWDTCAPQAILRALGGDVLNYAESIKEQKPVPLKYLEVETDSDWKRNVNGLIALRDLEAVKELLPKLQEN
ncbi:LOW QUALITY PROTEIN: inositol polyphosphate 1-phosphatase [Drosophila nasuta]|uniref:LOW QUALITY PROTEIN: inositol polyphosphate 1-phosphatase n=1 Tax=Drosophila nasuta TaxID=42062 RepID=UPI00295EC6FD|nr:LOW QUALITY PROTEIN: inositol polyphosphate 1-phosphatase [Drosophila nasuta]